MREGERDRKRERERKRRRDKGGWEIEQKCNGHQIIFSSHWDCLLSCAFIVTLASCTLFVYYLLPCLSFFLFSRLFCIPFQYLMMRYSNIMTVGSPFLLPLILKNTFLNLLTHSSSLSLSRYIYFYQTQFYLTRENNRRNKAFHTTPVFCKTYCVLRGDALSSNKLFFFVLENQIRILLFENF